MTIPSSAWSAPWTADDRCTQHQAKLSEKDLADWLAGKPHVAFDAFRKLVTPICGKFAFSFLEVGCGCGYNKAVLLSFCKSVIYQGIDISPSMIEYASEHFGYMQFSVGKAESLPFADATFDCVCPSAVIQHMPDYHPAIREAVRVSKRFVILHRVQATTGETNEFENSAYGTVLPTREINEGELLLFCESVGLTVKERVQWGVGPQKFNASYRFDKT